MVASARSAPSTMSWRYWSLTAVKLGWQEKVADPGDSRGTPGEAWPAGSTGGRRQTLQQHRMAPPTLDVVEWCSCVYCGK